ncbi:MAG: isoprenylcysteine carboxylmethyltransferase family protein [Bacillota bacterium]|nr:isoprenylcysteine carboxylmethyltransferase family protein [Bacillota bacterium]
MINIIFEKVITSLIILSVVSVFAAIFIDFKKFDRKGNVYKGKKSIVATGTMTGFYVVYYMFLRFKIGYIGIINYPVILIGAIMIIAGAALNIVGRFNLNSNWANHIKIYDDHKLITNGVYRIVRHPLYASIMLMLFGGCLAYRNWVCILLTAFVFVPFMYYRAKQEERLLEEKFPGYKEYRNKTGMFFLKLWR